MKSVDHAKKLCTTLYLLSQIAKRSWCYASVSVVGKSAVADRVHAQLLLLFLAPLLLLPLLSLSKHTWQAIDEKSRLNLSHLPKTCRYDA